MKSRVRASLAGAAAFALVIAATAAAAQTAAKGTGARGGGGAFSNPFAGFTRDRDTPVRIEANSLELFDRERYALFAGNVIVRQGESTMQSREMKVYYEPAAPARAAPKAKAGQARASGDDAEGGSQRIRRLEATGGVTITTRDQRATGDFAFYDLSTNHVTITGNVVVTQGPNVLRGEKLVVDLDTGWSRMEGADKGGRSRVQGLFTPTGARDAKTQKSGEAK